MSELTSEDSFFIGWLPMPASHRRFPLPIIEGILAIAVASSATIALLQRDPGRGQWDADEVRTFDGLLYTRPYAMLRVSGEKPGDPPRTLLLVEAGKFGAMPRVARLFPEQSDGRAVRATGTLLQREGRWMLELVEGEKGLCRLPSDEQNFQSLVVPPPRLLAETIALQGEIIDPKCFLGAMKPGGGKTHKACATLCISGGIPPMLVTRDAQKREVYFLLKTERGTANEMVLPFVGDAVEVTGRLEKLDDLLVLTLIPDGIRRR